MDFHRMGSKARPGIPLQIYFYFCIIRKIRIHILYIEKLLKIKKMFQLKITRTVSRDFSKHSTWTLNEQAKSGSQNCCAFAKLSDC